MKIDPNRGQQLLIGFFLVAVTLGVYGQVKDFEFINFDDPLYVIDNRQVQKGLSAETVIWAFTDATTETNYWVPLTWLSFLLDFELYGINAGGYHLSNVILHILSTLSLFYALRRMTGRLWQSAFVAALFALHPLHVESVAWVTERKDVLSTFFWMLTLLSYAGYAEKPAAIRYLAVFIFFAMGMMSKPMLVTLPFVMLLLDYWPLGRIIGFSSGAEIGRFTVKKKIARLIREKIPFFIVVAVSSVMTFLTQQEGGAIKSLADYPMTVRIANALVAYVVYIGKMFWPVRLAFFYPHPGGLPFWQTAAAAIILILISMAAIKTIRRFPYVAVGWLWYLGTLVPVIGLVVIGPYVVADRYTYIPLVGIFIVIAWGLPEMLAGRPYKQLALASAAIIIITVLSLVSWRQVQHWQDSVTLCKHAIRVTPKNLTAYNNLGVALEEKGRTGEAVKYYLESLQVDPNNFAAYNNLGLIYQAKGNAREAVENFQKALELEPKYAHAHNNLANVLISIGKEAEAIGHYEEAVKINPGYANAHYNLGNVRIRQGRLDAAAAHYLAVVKANPFHAEAFNNLGTVSALQGRLEEAMDRFQQALQIKPDYGEARENLEKIRSLRQGMDQKILELEETLRRRPGDVDLHLQLGRLYKGKGDLERAAVHFKQALSLRPGLIEALNPLGIMAAVRGDYEGARLFFRESIAGRPGDADAYYFMAGTFARQERTAEALEWLKRAVERGFNDWNRLQSDRNLDAIRGTDFYQSLIEGHKKLGSK